MTTAIVASLGTIVFTAIIAGFGKRCLKPLPKEHHGHGTGGVEGEHPEMHTEPKEETRVDTILLHDGGDKYWVLWKGYRRHKIVPKALQGKERVQLPTVESKLSLNMQDKNAVALFDEVSEMDIDELEDCDPESDQWKEFEKCLLEAQHEHGMRPMTYPYPHLVNRQLCFTRAAAFRQRYVQLINRNTRSGRKKIDLDKSPEVEL
jgi:hypothetical protein